MLKRTKHLLSEIDNKLSGGMLDKSDYLTNKLYEYAIILFHAEFETHVKFMIFNQIGYNHISEQIKKSMGKAISRGLSYGKIKDNFQKTFWNKVEYHLKQQLPHGDDFETLKQNYSTLMEIRHDIAHTGSTQRVVSLDIIKDAVRFCEYLINSISKYYR
ncbi:MAG: HEPN domain-containing protein [Candidatus Magnetobacterium sp. LHC-1]|nr:hypothetical protein [Nitrospirota bacterium]